MTPRYYFAYGSNMNPERVRERGIAFDEVLAGVLPDMRLTFDKRSRHQVGAGHANIRYARGESVAGVLYRLTPPEEILRMDPFEVAPRHYGRDAVWVLTEAGNVAAWTYFANAAVIDPTLKPPRWYLQHLLAGREFLPAAYVRWLEGVCCLDDPLETPKG